MKKMNVWRVQAFDMHEPEPDCFVFTAYFSTREAAEVAYERGEREFGIANAPLRWTLEGFHADDPLLVECQFDDIKKRYAS